MKQLTNINFINIVLMLIAGGLALFVPIQLFLLSYIILGPLHYLTEISWLKDRQFFIKKQDDRNLFLVAIDLLLLGSGFISGIAWLKPLINTHILLLYIVSISTIGLILFEKKQYKIMFVLAVGLSSFMLTNNIIGLIFAVYLTTLIHVYLFTGMFILSGVMKQPSKLGIISFLVFISIPFIFFLLPYLRIELFHYQPNQYFTTLYYQSFALLNTMTFKDIFGLGTLFNSDIFINSWSVALSRFFAFAYTYHYLNWFSKTKVIKWNEISQLRMVLIVLVWIASLTLYFINPVLGYKALFLLSYSHVLLEFPLNAVAGIHIVNTSKSYLLKNNKASN